MKMAKTVNLSLHKSQVERRERKAVRGDMVAAAKAMPSNDIVAWAIVGITRDGNAHAAWDSGQIMPLWAFAPAISRILQCDTDTVQDDYKAPLRRLNWPKG